MSDYIAPVLKPVNRHLTIIPHPQSEKTSSGVILPDDFKPEEDRATSPPQLLILPRIAVQHLGNFADQARIAKQLLLSDLWLKRSL
jgi:hypothetical protein